MQDRETQEYVTAFAIGAAIGVAAAFFFRPRRTAAERLVRRIEPYRKRAVKGARRAGRAVSGSAEDVVDRSGELVLAGRDVLDEFREELVGMASTARAEVAKMVEGQVKQARRSLRRGAKRLGA